MEQPFSLAFALVRNEKGLNLFLPKGQSMLSDTKKASTVMGPTTEAEIFGRGKKERRMMAFYLRGGKTESHSSSREETPLLAINPVSCWITWKLLL
ncbi:Hypothetical protein NTJ_13037 [Nesidiocoris tenuis]|uniref:Uncharacterized protein n=1 Tax=Nesidiocoris tenuis TaxID=355587 RepID=A0ABN7B740_9HEMI|nr:Hypothetical protein NTJ_13037 [Nesidiocoris tenuis]